MPKSLILLLILCCPAPQLHASEIPRVMIIHSYGETHISSVPQEQGVIHALRDAGWMENKNIVYKTFYMDTQRVYTTPELIKQRATLALDAIHIAKPQIVVVLDDNAIREVMMKLIDQPDIQLVFSGMNGQATLYHRKKPFIDNPSHPGHNATGIYEKLHLQKALRVMSATLGGFGENDKVIGITDYSPTGFALKKQFEIEISEQNPPVNWELRRVRDFREYRLLIHQLNKDDTVRAIYPVALSLADEQGKPLSVPEIFQWTTANSGKPEMALNALFSKIGLLGGAAVDFKAMGYQAGQQVAAILSGTPAGELPIEDAQEYAIVFNNKRAKMLDLSIPEALLTAADHVYDTFDEQ